MKASTVTYRCIPPARFLDIPHSSGYNPTILTRVSPSGKATASQAVIRGFESHHPLFVEKHPDAGAFFEIFAKNNKFAMKFIKNTCYNGSNQANSSTDIFDTLQSW